MQEKLGKNFSLVPEGRTTWKLYILKRPDQWAVIMKGNSSSIDVGHNNIYHGLRKYT